MLLAIVSKACAPDACICNRVSTCSNLHQQRAITSFRLQGSLTGNLGTYGDVCCDMVDFLAASGGKAELIDTLAASIAADSSKQTTKKAGKGAKGGKKARKAAAAAIEDEAEPQQQPNIQVRPCIALA
jgi:hypothetical protein